LRHVETAERVLIVARVVVKEARLDSQLAGGPLLLARSPVYSGTNTEMLVVVGRLIRGVVFCVEFGDGLSHTSSSVPVDVLRLRDLPAWLLNGTFTSAKPFSLAGHSVTYYGGVVRHMFREPGIYPAVVKATGSAGE